MPARLLAALPEQRAHVHGFLLADHNVSATRAQGIPWSNGDIALARMAQDLQAARYPPAVQIAVMQPVLLNNVVVETVEVFFRQQLPGEETRTAEAL
jgi:hypothetical protein